MDGYDGAEPGRTLYSAPTHRSEYVDVVRRAASAPNHQTNLKLKPFETETPPE